MILLNKLNVRSNPYIFKILVIGFCCNIIYKVSFGSSGIPVKNAIAPTNSLNTQTTTNNTYFKLLTLSVKTPEDSVTIYYNLGWEAYKNSNFDNARYYWEKGSLSNTNTKDKFNCLFRLGLLQQVGEGVEINLESAFNFYMKASNNGKPGGNVDATKNIGTYYENGMFVAKDNKKALEWYLKAKEQGNRYCDDDIARVKKNMYDLFEDLNKH